MQIKLYKVVGLIVAPCVIGIALGVAQDDKVKPTAPTATQWVLDATRSEPQKNAVKSVMKIVCPKDRKKGTGFVLEDSGIVMTNAHVVGSCAPQELEATSSLGDAVKFSKGISDKNRDLAILCPTKRPLVGLRLSEAKNPSVDNDVETWGYPLRWDSSAPILSRGYVAGYVDRTYRGENGLPGPSVKHLVVNGAFNPGNSGGPLIERSSGRVIGVVVEKWTLFSPLAELVINSLYNSPTRTGGSLVKKDEHGNVTQMSNEEATAAVLEEFYNDSQVMIGEAISVIEVDALLKARLPELGCNK